MASNKGKFYLSSNTVYGQSQSEKKLLVIQVVSKFCLLIINIKETENLDNDINDSLEMYPSCNAVGYDIIHWKPNINDKKFSPFEEEQ